MAETTGKTDLTEDIKFHNRLDLRLGSEHFSDAPCGSIHLGTGKPHYCSFDCPVLKGTEPAQKPKTAAQLEKEAILARLKELEAV